MIRFYLPSLPILLVVAAFIGLGTVYSVITPIFEASDELWHYPVVKHLADGRGLPVQNPQEEQLWRQEGSQPPLYYTLAALATFWINTDDMTELRWVNPHAQIGVPLAHGNKNMVIHTERENFPYHGTALALHLIRFLSVLMGAVTVFLTYRIALEAFPQAEALATGAAVLVAFNPMFLFISGSVNNDNLVVPLSSLTILLLLSLTNPGPAPTFSKCTLLGLVIGLASVTKLSALGLIPLTIVVLGVVAWRDRSLTDFAVWSAVVLSIVAAIAGWWYLRNWRLYGDPLGINLWLAVAGARKVTPSLADLMREFEGFRLSFWGLFGGVNILADRVLYRFYDLLSLLGVVGLVPFAVKRWRKGEALIPFSLVILALWIAVILLALVRWTAMTAASQGRLMFPAISAISILLFLGLASWLPVRFHFALVGVLGGALFLIALSIPFRYIAPAYAKPAALSEEETGGISHRLEVNFGDQMELLGYEIGREEIKPGEDLAVTLYWRSLTRMERDYSVFVHLLDENDLMIAQVDTYPGLGTHPTSLWREGDTIADVYVLSVPPQAFTPNTARLEVGLYDYTSGDRLLAKGAGGRAIGDNVRFGKIAVLPREEGGLPNPVTFIFEGKIALVGYDIDRRAVPPGGTLQLTLYWRALADLGKDYTVFTHMLGDRDQIWAQMDSQPQGGAAPTSAWVKGQVVKDEYRLVVRPDTPLDVYDLEVGLYLQGSGKRLMVLGELGAMPDNRVLLSKIRVVD